MSSETTDSLPKVPTTQAERDESLRSSLRFEEFDDTLEVMGCGVEFPLFPSGDKTRVHYDPHFNVGTFSAEQLIEYRPNATVRLHISAEPAIADTGFTPFSPTDSRLRLLYYPQTVKKEMEGNARVIDLADVRNPLALHVDVNYFSALEGYSFGLSLPRTGMRFVLPSLLDEQVRDILGSHSEFVDATDSQTYIQALREGRKDHKGGIFLPSDRESLKYLRGFIVSNKEVVRNILTHRPIDTHEGS